MSSNFFSLPREIRDQIYEPVLLHQEPIDLCINYYGQQELTPGLLRANKAVHREASSLFYTRNRFDFTMCTLEDVPSFLGQIDRSNADYIRHIHLDFPNFLHLDPGDVTLQDESVSILANIQSSCTNLSTLSTSLYSTNVMELTLDALDNPKVITEALKLVDTHFRAIPSLQEIIVEMSEDGPDKRQLRLPKGEACPKLCDRALAHDLFVSEVAIWADLTIAFVNHPGFDSDYDFGSQQSSQ